MSKEFDFSGLSVGERVLLAQDLWDSVFDEAEMLPLTEFQEAEARRRISEIDAGEVVPVAWEQARQRLRSAG